MHATKILEVLIIRIGSFAEWYGNSLVLMRISIAVEEVMGTIQLIIV